MPLAYRPQVCNGGMHRIPRRMHLLQRTARHWTWWQLVRGPPILSWPPPPIPSGEPLLATCVLSWWERQGELDNSANSSTPSRAAARCC